MKITDEDQLSTDFDWFAVDEVGHIGHFTSAGYKLLPRSVSASKDDLERVSTYFLKDAPNHSSFQMDPDIANELPEWKELHLESFTSMAERGLFSFDIASHLKNNATYFRVALPAIPLSLENLPTPVRDIVNRTKLLGINLANCSRVPYALTLEI